MDGLKAQLKSQPTNTALRNLIDALTPDTLDILAQKVAVQNTLAKASVFPSANVSGILVDNQQEADDLLAQAKNGADFGQLAKDHSLDTDSASKGGDLAGLCRSTERRVQQHSFRNESDQRQVFATLRRQLRRLRDHRPQVNGPSPRDQRAGPADRDRRVDEHVAKAHD